MMRDTTVKMSKNKKAVIRRKADNVLQDYIREKHKLCWVCGERYVVCGHHFIPCSNSNAVRYYIPNLIPICQSCHFKVHSQPHLVEPVICFKLGQEWYNDLIETKRQGVKTNLGWYKMNLKILEELIEEL